MNQMMTVEVADFVEAVDAALADLPADVRAELLEDLPAHLADVVADGGTPIGQLGEPRAYAAELRAAAGHPPSTPRKAQARDLLAKLRAADARVGATIGYMRITDLLRALQPAWWVLRGYLALLLLTSASGRTGANAVTPNVYDSEPLGFAVLLALIAASVWVGRRTSGSHRNLVVAVSTVVTLVLAVTGANVARRAIAPVTLTEITTDVGPLGDTSNISNIYPFGPDGKVQKNIRLVDQDGNPISLASPCDYDPADESADPQTFPVVCPEGHGAFNPEAPIKPLPSRTPSTPATSASSAPTPSTSPTTSASR